MIRQAAAVLAFAFVVAHLTSIPQSLEDIDSVNFALGVRHFDVAEHRPHPPGYPVYIAAAKGAVGLGSLIAGARGETEGDHRRSRLEARALALLSLAGAVIVIVSLYRLFACFSRPDDDRLGQPWRALDARALAATALSVACPLFWYMSVRPMSDVPGMAVALASLVCLGLAWWRQQPVAPGDRRLEPAHVGASGRMIVLGSLVAAVSIGLRLQNAVLILPFLFAVLIDRIGRGVAGALLGAGVAFSVGTLAWGIPLLVASGGLDAYLAALGSQAGEDFAGVQMLYLNPSPRLAANALLRTFIYPWDSVPLGTVVCACALIGGVRLVIRDRRTFAALTVMTLPYLGFHLLFQDMDFVRYALPLVPPIAFLAVTGLETIARPASLVITGALSLWSVAIGAPTAIAYAAELSPVVRVLDAMKTEAQANAPIVLANHQTYQRPLEAEAVPFEQRLSSPPRREWLELARYWRGGNIAPVWFLADPRRTDLALVDPKSRADRRDFSWHFTSLSTIGGMRPAAVQWYRLQPPGWFAEEGWALTPETAGMARAMGRGPSSGPITAWVRRRPDPTRMLIGGRHLGSAADPPARFTVTIDGRAVTTWEVRAGFFLQLVDLPAGSLTGNGALAKLEVQSEPIGSGSATTAIEQFDLQTAGSLLWGFDQGWQEAEYDPHIGLWRWTSERAVLRIIDASRAVSIRLQMESPRRYFSNAPTVRLTAAGHVLAEAHPFEDSVLEASVSADVLRASGGMVAVETDHVFVPAQRRGGDQRHLGLRVFGISVAFAN